MLSIDQLHNERLSCPHFILRAGEIVSVSGESGSGKSVFLRAIADLDPNVGEVTLEGESRDVVPAQKWRKMVSYLAADSGWWHEQVAAHFADLPAAQAWLPKLRLKENLLEREVQRLSGGERQRLALLRALLLSPKVLLLDEPTSALDPEAVKALEQVLKDFCKQGGAVLMITHDPAQAARLANRQLQVVAGVVSEVSA